MAVTFVSAGAVTGSNSNLTPALPAGAVTGDIMLLFAETANQAITAPAGWADAVNTAGTGTAGATTATRLTIFWKRHTGSEAAPTIANAGDHVVAGILAFRGVLELGNPWDVAPQNTTAAAATAVTFPSVTTVTNNCMIVGAVSNPVDGAGAQCSGYANAALTGIAERADNNDNAGNGGGVAVFTGMLATAGAAGTSSATLASAVVQHRATIALRPSTFVPAATRPATVVGQAVVRAATR